MNHTSHKSFRLLVLFMMVLMISSCAALQGDGPSTERSTARDKTKKGALIGAATGAVLGAVIGEGEADEILASAVIGAGIGAGVGAYMDKQEEKVARIPGTTVERLDEETLLVHFDSDVLFELNKSDLDTTARDALTQAAEVIKEFNKTAVVIQGHTDSTGSAEYNQGLSEQRADSVRNFLARAGVADGRMASIGYGEDHPVADNETKAGRALNRRVDMLLKAKVR